MEAPGEVAENLYVRSPRAKLITRIVAIGGSSEKSATGSRQENGEEALSGLRRSASGDLAEDHNCKKSRLQASALADEIPQSDVPPGGSLCSDGETAVDADVVVNNDDLPDDFLAPLESPLALSPIPIMHLDTQGPQQISRNMAKVMFRQFWKAGEFDNTPSTKDIDLASGMEHIRVHPKFLHSNATSHKWALGAIAELLDNAIDEAVNGATFVNVDMVQNLRNRSPMLMIEDNGGGMSPERMRQCMSLGYSAKSKVANTIGQYGNGFKTSTMRLGADVIVFSRTKSKDGLLPTQSIGLLSYTFLMATGHDDIIVPILDYEMQPFGLKKLVKGTVDDWNRNMEIVLQWSPYHTEQALLDQLQRIKDQGTIVIIFNLWEDDEGKLELDFDADPFDIQLRGTNRDDRNVLMASKYSHCKHFFTYKFSLRSYASILYLRLPKKFGMVLRGKEVTHHRLASDLMLVEQVKYKPKVPVLSYKDAVADVTLGFVKDAKEHIDVQGFNVYHKNRLIRPFWRVWITPSIAGRGIVGILEANFVEPAHDKQGFERTTVFARLETRLIEMQKNYWARNCQVIGYVGYSKKNAVSQAAVTGGPPANKTSNNRTLSSSPNVKYITPSRVQKTSNMDLVSPDKAIIKSQQSNRERSVSTLVKEALPSQHILQNGSSRATSAAHEKSTRQTSIQSGEPRRSDRLKMISAVSRPQTTEARRVQGRNTVSLPATSPAQSCSAEVSPRHHGDLEAQTTHGLLGSVKSISRGLAEAQDANNQMVKPLCLRPEYDANTAQQTVCKGANEDTSATSAALKALDYIMPSSSDANQANHVWKLDQPPGTSSENGQLIHDVSGQSLQAPLISESRQDSNEALISPSSQCDRHDRLESSQCTSRNAIDVDISNSRPRNLTRSMLQLQQSHAKAARLDCASLQQIQQPMAGTTTDLTCLANTIVEDGDPPVTAIDTFAVDRTISSGTINELEGKLGSMKQRLTTLHSDLDKVNRERDFLKGELEEERRRQLRLENELKKRLQSLTLRAAELEAANSLLEVCQK